MSVSEVDPAAKPLHFETSHFFQPSPSDQLLASQGGVAPLSKSPRKMPVVLVSRNMPFPIIPLHLTSLKALPLVCRLVAVVF